MRVSDIAPDVACVCVMNVRFGCTQTLSQSSEPLSGGPRTIAPPPRWSKQCMGRQACWPCVQTCTCTLHPFEPLLTQHQLCACHFMLCHVLNVQGGLRCTASPQLMQSPKCAGRRLHAKGTFDLFLANGESDARSVVAHMGALEGNVHYWFCRGLAFATARCTGSAKKQDSLRKSRAGLCSLSPTGRRAPLLAMALSKSKGPIYIDRRTSCSAGGLVHLVVSVESALAERAERVALLVLPARGESGDGGRQMRRIRGLLHRARAANGRVVRERVRAELVSPHPS